MPFSRLEQNARKVAFGRARTRNDIRRDMRELTLTALRSRVLTLPHVAAVALAIANGIDPARIGAPAPMPASRSLAQEGLLQAIAKALTALDVATHEYVSVGGRICAAEVGEWLAALEAIGAIDGKELAGRVTTLKQALSSAESPEAAESSYALALLASGALLGLIEADRPAPAKSLKAS
jgi:hypothetical protein